MGNFEKLSVLVIVVIIVMILVVALYTWTDDPAAEEGDGMVVSSLDTPTPTPEIRPAPPRDGGDTPARIDGTGFVSPDPRWTSGGTSDRGGDTIAPIVDDTPKPEETQPAQPPASEPETTYTVKEGDSYGKIAVEQLGSFAHWTKIRDLNGIPPERLRKGMVLKLPRIDGAAPSGDAPAPSGEGPRPGSTYTVRQGDTLPRIAQRAYGNKDLWPDIWLANLARLDDPSQLSANMTLELPAR
jgi:LysM repeat protein